MIEVSAELMRKDSGTYATGEYVECLIKFTHLIQADAKSVNATQNLAWASAQIHCYRKTSYTLKPKDPISNISEKLGKTALNTSSKAPGDIVIETKPKILFCDLDLEPGETKKYLYTEIIPRNGPPTYLGQDIRYFYRITIASQRVKSSVQSFTMPFIVLPMPVVPKPEESQFTEETIENLAPTNPFLEKREPSELEMSWHFIKNITARRAPKYYRITNKHGFVAKFCLFKHCYKIGEDIVGSLDFTDRTVRCVQYSAKLQSIEIDMHDKINQEVSTNNNKQDSNDTASVNSIDLASVASGSTPDNLKKSSTSATGKDDEEPTGKISTFTRNHEVCYAVVQTFIQIPIPLHVTPSFQTELVEVRWRIHFEFVTSTMMDFGQPDPKTGILNAPEEIHVETMVWDLPITLYAANPLQIYSPSQKQHMIIK